MGLVNRVLYEIKRYVKLREAEEKIREWEDVKESMRKLPFVRVYGYPIPRDVCDAMVDSVLLKR